MNHFGEKDTTFKSDSDILGLKFQVTDVRQPLLAARRLVEKGNIVAVWARTREQLYHEC